MASLSLFGRSLPQVEAFSTVIVIIAMTCSTLFQAKPASTRGITSEMMKGWVSIVSYGADKAGIRGTK